jgi:hypothetical protein
MPDNINTSDADTGDIMIQLSFPTQSDPGGIDEDRNIGHFTITDRMSGQVLIDVDLSAAEFLSMMSGTGTPVSRARLPARPVRIGMRAEVFWARIPLTYGADKIERAAQITAVVAQYESEGWIATARRTNSGDVVVARRWIDDDGNPML